MQSCLSVNICRHRRRRHRRHNDDPQSFAITLNAHKTLSRTEVFTASDTNRCACIHIFTSTVNRNFRSFHYTHVENGNVSQATISHTHTHTPNSQQYIPINRLSHASHSSPSHFFVLFLFFFFFFSVFTHTIRFQNDFHKVFRPSAKGEEKKLFYSTNYLSIKCAWSVCRDCRTGMWVVVAADRIVVICECVCICHV